jgi:hypothetical protein
MAADISLVKKIYFSLLQAAIEWRALKDEFTFVLIEKDSSILINDSFDCYQISLA